MIRRNRQPPKPYKLIKNERGQTISEDCALVFENCEDLEITGGYVFDADRNGIYFQRNCHGNRVTNYRLKRVNGVPIYIDSGCTHNIIEDSLIEDSGWWVSERNWREVKFDIRRFGFLKREAIAVDDAQWNEVRRNRIKRCGLAGVTFYRNCGERGTFTRGAGANNNTAEKNHFEDVTVGIWNAARQYRDMSAWGCLDCGTKVPLWKIPHQPYQQWFDWSAFINCLSGEFQNPFRLAIHQVDDVCFGNEWPGNTFERVKYEVIDNA